MNRRSALRLARVLLAVTTVAVVAFGAHAPAGAASDPAVPDEPVTTANPFLPDDRDLSDCLGLVERPGCGSEERGGVHQTLVAIVMIAGLALIFGRVAWGVRRSQRRHRTPHP